MGGVSNIWLYLVKFEICDTRTNRQTENVLRYRDPSDLIKLRMLLLVFRVIFSSFEKLVLLFNLITFISSLGRFQFNHISLLLAVTSPWDESMYIAPPIWSENTVVSDPSGRQSACPVRKGIRTAHSNHGSI